MEKESRVVPAAAAGGTEGGRRPTGVPPAAAAGGQGVERAAVSEHLPGVELRAVDLEVRERPVRRRFTAEYKAQLLVAADACTRPGELGALLRREGLYASHLTAWRKQREAGALEALAPKRRGRKALAVNPLTAEIERLQRENERLSTRLKQAETIIEVQKKVAELLGLTPSATPRAGSN